MFSYIGLVHWLFEISNIANLMFVPIFQFCCVLYFSSIISISELAYFIFSFFHFFCSRLLLISLSKSFFVYLTLFQFYYCVVQMLPLQMNFSPLKTIFLTSYVLICMCIGLEIFWLTLRRIKKRDRRN